MAGKGKDSERRQARELSSQGWSLKAIAKHFGVSRSSVSRWVRDVALTSEQIAQLKARSFTNTKGNFEKARLTRLAKEEKRREAIRQEARQLYERYWHEPFFMAGLTGYWAEGNKHENPKVGVTNISPEFLRMMMAWLMRYGGVHIEDFQLVIRIHEGSSIPEEECRKFWQQQLGITDIRFQRKQNKQPLHPFRQPYGIACLYARRSTNLFIRITEWLKCL